MQAAERLLWGAQLASLGLRDGQNTIDFMFGRQRLRAYIYFLHWHTRCACNAMPHLTRPRESMVRMPVPVALDLPHSLWKAPSSSAQVEGSLEGAQTVRNLHARSQSGGNLCLGQALSVGAGCFD